MEEGHVVETEFQKIQGRRRAMKKIAIGVGVIAGAHVLPEEWTKPIIGQMVLPANAATSGAAVIDDLDVEYRIGDETSESVTVKVSGVVSPPVGGVPVTVTVTPVF